MSKVRESFPVRLLLASFGYFFIFNGLWFVIQETSHDSWQWVAGMAISAVGAAFCFTES